MAGYSATPLAAKLGIRPGSRVKTLRAPGNYPQLLDPLPEAALVSASLRGNIDIWHLFTKRRAGLSAELERAMKSIPPNGVIWVSWPKKASGVATDMSEDEIRRAALPLGLVDVKVSAIDDTWSGLKLVIRKSNRK